MKPRCEAGAAARTAASGAQTSPPQLTPLLTLAALPILQPLLLLLLPKRPTRQGQGRGRRRAGSKARRIRPQGPPFSGAGWGG